MNPSGSPIAQVDGADRGTAAAKPPVSQGRESVLLLILFFAALVTHVGFATYHWSYGFLVGHEFRQTHTAIITYYLDQENRFSLHYTTPLFGKPWSVPLEFPLYEWSVVLLSRAAHVPHFEAARTVSLTCFYLMLPAIYLLLGQLGLAAPRRLLALALILTCPLYIFYSRAFLMESMVLMFSAWFLAMFVRTMQERRLRWLVLCAIAGAGAGLIKSTTFFVWLLPAALYGAWFLGRSLRPWSGWKPVGRTFAWGLGAALVPCGLTYWWVKYTDAIKAPHPSAYIFASRQLTEGSFGLYSLGARFSPEIWRALMGDWRLAIMSPWIIGLFIAAGAVCFKRQRWHILGAAGFFLFAQVLFPAAYAYQDYYFYACTVFLLIALGFVLHGVLESRLPHWIRWTIVIVPLAAMLGSYRWGYYSGLPVPVPPGGKPSTRYGGREPEHYQWGYYWDQAVRSNGGSGLADALRNFTPEDSVIIVAGSDWAPMIPYYSQRKALMIRNGLEVDWEYLTRAFNDLADEDVSALVLAGNQRNNHELLRRAAAAFGLDTSVTFSSPFADVYLSNFYRESAVGRLNGNHGFHQITTSSKPRDPLSKDSPPTPIPPGVAADAFKMVSPKPIQYRFTYGYSMMEVNGTPTLNVHPDSDLWVPAPAGARHIWWGFGIVPEAYERAGQKTNGVDFIIDGEAPNGSRREIFRRVLNPVVVPGDRGMQRAAVLFQPLPGEKLVFRTRPNVDYAYDWAYWTRIEVR